MKNKDKLEEEKTKLNMIVGEALDNGSTLTQNEIVTLSCKVDTLVAKAQKEKKKHVKKQQER